MLNKALILLVAILVISCGVKGNPLPPENDPQPSPSPSVKALKTAKKRLKTK